MAEILRLLKHFDRKETRVDLGWVPAHAGVPGNKEADRVARESAHKASQPLRPKAKRQREVEGLITLLHNNINNQRQNKPLTTTPGQHMWKIDQALPGKHTLNLYRAMSSDQTAILIQARTRHCWLNKSLYQKNLTDSACCRCGKGDETIEHVLLTCPRWTKERRALCELVGNSCNHVPFLLGGYGTRKERQSDCLLDRKRENWKPDIKVVKTTIEFLQKTGCLEYSYTREE